MENFRVTNKAVDMRLRKKVRGWRYQQNFRAVEGIVSRGDRSVAAVIEAAWRKGCRLDGWSDHLRFDLWMEALEEVGLDRWKFLRTIPIDARVPWDHIDCGVEWRFLQKEYKKALKDRLSTPCGKPAWQLIHHRNLEDDLEEKKKL